MILPQVPQLFRSRFVAEPIMSKPRRGGTDAILLTGGRRRLICEPLGSGLPVEL